MNQTSAIQAPNFANNVNKIAMKKDGQTENGQGKEVIYRVMKDS